MFAITMHGTGIGSSTGTQQLHLKCVCFLESGFRKTIFQTFLCLYAIRKVGQRKTISGQRKIWLGFQESVFLLFWTENTF
jgi:hypothetical protein